MQQEIREKTTKPSHGKDRSDLAELALCHLLFAAIGALVGSAELLFGVRPFGVALAAVATSYLPAIGGGIGLYCLLTRDYLSLISLLTVLLLRLAYSLFRSGTANGRSGGERPAFRISAAAIAVFTVGIYTVVKGGYRYFDLFGILLAVAAAPLAAFLFLGIFEEKDKLFPMSREAGLAALALTAIFAVRAVSFFGIYPAAVAAAGAAFLLVSHRDLLWGSLGGALAGLCFDWRMAPAFLLCGVAFGLLQKSSRGGGVIAGSAAAGTYAFLLRGTAGIMTLLPALLTAGALFLAFDSAGLIEGAPARVLSVARRRAAAQAAKAGEGAATERRMREIAAAFLDLSGTFYELSSRQRRPAHADLRHLCDSAFNGVCPGCRNRDVCWGSEYGATADAVSALAARLYQNGTVTEAGVPARLTARCTELSGILKTINSGAAALSGEALHGDKTSVVAMDYAAVGRMINEAIEEGNERFSFDAATAERIEARLLRLGYHVESVAVCGKQHRRVILRGIRLPGRHLKIRELRRELEKFCHFPLGEPQTGSGDGLSDITFPEKNRFSTATVKFTRKKGKGEGKHCGDTVMSLSGERGYDYALICDGMGSGNAAALTSALAGAFLSRLLQAGGRADSALRMLNGFLAARGRQGSETSTTVDLLEIDRVSGEASLFKCGAAPTYLLRRGEITRFFSRTAPVGILEALDAERIRFSVEAGDVIVQVSDGFTGGEEECPWLARMLAEKWDGDAEDFARLAIGRAAKELSDDLSIVVTEVLSEATAAEEKRETA